MKWLLYQVLVIPVIMIFMWLLEITVDNRIKVPVSGEATLVNSPILTFLVIASMITLIYLIFLFEAKKEKNIFDHVIWKQMPKICIAIGIISSLLFIIGGTVGPIMEWTLQWRSLMYLFMIYFLSLVFLFVFSIEHKRKRSSQQHEKTVHISYFWTILLFFALFLFF